MSMNIVTPLLTKYRRFAQALSFTGKHQNPERSRRVLQNQINKGKHIYLFARLLATCFLMLGFTTFVFAQTSQTITTSGNFTVPAGVTSVTVQVWGAGGGGGGSKKNDHGGSGGGGGGYISSNFTVTSGGIIAIKVGAGGAAGGSNSGSGGTGGTSTATYSSTTLTATGGTGGAGNAGDAGTGGSPGGFSGTSGTSSKGGDGGDGGGIGGGAGGASTTNGRGNTGNSPGGGGGGGYKSKSNEAGGAGADGQVIVSWITVSATSTQTCIGGSTGTITATAVGGTSPYTYSTDGITYQTSATFSGLAAGNYTIFAKDASGLIAFNAVAVNTPAASTDPQTPGSNSWIGYVYEGTNFTTYYGHYTEAETFDESFGGATTCFPITSNSSTPTSRSIYTETFSVKYLMNSTGKGLYVVDLGSDDGSRLTVDGNLIYNNWSDQSWSSKPSVLMNLTGSSSLEYDYYENTVDNRVVFQNLTLVLANTLTTNTTQTVPVGSTGAAISGDIYGTLPAGISLSGTTGYQWVYSTTPGGATTNITGATGATYAPNASTAPFNTTGTYYIYRIAALSSTNNVSPKPYVATNESNVATITIATPSITVTPTAATFAGNVGVNSASQSFTVTGAALTTNITITAPAYYQVSTDNATWSASAGSVTLGTTGGTLYVRYVPTTAESSVVKTVTLASTGATTQNITVTGTAYNGAIYVRVGGYNHKDGTSWSNAMATVQKAVETSYLMTTKLPVYVAAGDYYQDPNYTTVDYAKYTSGGSNPGVDWEGWANTFVMREGVNVYGAFPENGTPNNNNADTTMRVPLSTATLYLTRLHAGPSPGGTTDYRVLGPVYSVTPIGGGSGFTTPTKWDGFELTGSNIPDYGGTGDDVCGAGAFTVANSTISNCIIDKNTVGNSSNDGAGVEMNGGTLLSCIVHDNTGTGGSSAGTINVRSGGSNVINCAIFNNTMDMAGGAISINIYTQTTTQCYFINNTMSQNTVSIPANGAEIHIFNGSSDLYFYNNAVWDNPAVNLSVSGVTKANENYNAWPNNYTTQTGGLNINSFNLSQSNNSGTGTNPPPWFVNPIADAAADFRLQSNASALYIKKGLSSAASPAPAFPTTDIRGVFRNTPPEIGCYELASRLYYVNNATGTDATGYGLNWSNPYKTVQYAISQYNPYDLPQIWVAAGTVNLNYIPSAGAPFYLKQNMAIYGGFAGNQALEFPTTSAMVTSILNSRNLKANQTILVGNGSSVVGTATGDFNWNGAILDGFTITGATGGSSKFAAVIPIGATIENCKIINNATSGLQLQNGANAYNMVVADNTAGDGVNMAGTANLVNGTIVNNSGYGINSSSTTATVTNSILWGNSDNVNLSGSIPNITYTASAAPLAYASSTTYPPASNSWWNKPGNIELYQRSPNFKNPKNGYIPNRNYELLLISPCLGVGTVVAKMPSIDANGKPRIYNTNVVDMGAFEKWDGYVVSSGTGKNTNLFRTTTPIFNSASLASIGTATGKDSVEVEAVPGANLTMGNNTIYVKWLELMQDTISSLPAQLTKGTMIADSVLYVHRFSKTLNNGSGAGKGVWSFFGVPFNTAPMSTLDGAVDENTVRIETYSENARAENGIDYAWPAGRLNTASTIKAGTGYALSFNSKVPQNDIGQTVIFSSPGTTSPVTFNESGTPTPLNVPLTASSSPPAPHWYDCGWNLIANPLPQTAGINAPWASTSQSYYGAAYFYKPYTDNYDVYPRSMLATNSSAIAPNAAFFIQTDVGGATATFTAGAGTGTPLVNMDFARPVLSSNATDATTASASTVQPARFQFKVTGGGDYCNTFVVFDSLAHADMEPIEDNPTMAGVTAKPALQLSTTATGSATSLAINRLPFTGSAMTVPMQVYAPVAGSYTITMPVSDTIAKTVELQDTTGALHNLTTGGYTFTTTTDGMTNNYTLIFSGTSATLVVKGVTIIQDQRNVIITCVSPMQQVALYGEAGQTYYLQNPSSDQVTLQMPASAGVYLLKVVTAEGVITKKLVNRQ
jgi:hypothetical protein